jgi:hypothetical protein
LVPFLALVVGAHSKTLASSMARPRPLCAGRLRPRAPWGAVRALGAGGRGMEDEQCLFNGSSYWLQVEMALDVH